VGTNAHPARRTSRQGPEWLDKALERGRAELPQLVDEANRLLPDGVYVTQVQVDDVLDALEAGKAPLLRLGAVGFAWVVAHVESGDEAAAQGRYLESQATFTERNAAIDAAGDAAFNEAKERSDAWEAFKDTFSAIAQAVGDVGLPIVVALVKKAVGI